MALPAASEVRRQFEENCGHSCSDEIIDVVSSMCGTYGLDVENFVLGWVAYATNKCISLVPTEKILDDFLQEDALKNKMQPSPMTPIPKKPKSFHRTIDMSADDNILDMYGTPNLDTPKTTKKRRRTFLNRSPFAPKERNKSSSKFKDRTNARTVCMHFGAIENPTWVESAGAVRAIRQADEAFALTKHYNYSKDVADERHERKKTSLETFRIRASKALGVEVMYPRKAEKENGETFIGRICSKDPGKFVNGNYTSGKLTINSIGLEDLSEDNEADVPLAFDVTKLENFSFFPGQIVVFDGICKGDVQGKEIVTVSKLHDEVHLEFSQNNHENTEGVLQVIIAAGPYTTSDSCGYEPLEELLKYVDEHVPDVCILAGPFVDSKNDPLEEYNKSNKEDFCTYDDIFTYVIDRIAQTIEGTKTKFVIIPSCGDLSQTTYTYPTPPHIEPEHENILYCSDPCTLDIDGVTIGITSVDILLHLASKELRYPASAPNRIPSLARHLLVQQNFYSLDPSQDINVDPEHFEKFCCLTVKPHVLILPSDLKYFVQDVEGCCIINPERLAKGSSGGTFARFQVDRACLKKESIVSSVTVEIIKI